MSDPASYHLRRPFTDFRQAVCFQTHPPLRELITRDSERAALLGNMGSSRHRAARIIVKVDAHYSVMTLSAHSTSDTKIVGLPNFAPHGLKSVSVTPRARQHVAHA
jgi:hypothetical protein